MIKKLLYLFLILAILGLGYLKYQAYRNPADSIASPTPAPVESLEPTFIPEFVPPSPSPSPAKSATAAASPKAKSSPSPTPIPSASP